MCECMHMSCLKACVIPVCAYIHACIISVCGVCEFLHVMCECERV